jgi:signal transduction histidine kinase
MRLSIKTKQVAGVTSIVGLLVVVLSVLHLSSLSRVSLQESQARGQLLAHAIYQRSRAVVSGAPDGGLRAILESSLYSKNVTDAAVVNPRGEIIAHYDPKLVGTSMPERPGVEALISLNGWQQLWAIFTDEGQTFDVREPLTLGDTDFGAIRIGISTLLVRAELESALRPAIYTAVIALIVATAVAVLLAQLMLRPIHVLRLGLQRLERGESPAVLDLPQDEFGDLGTQIRTVSEKLLSGRASPEEALRYSQKLAALGRLSAGVAHEVKNPLNAMTIHLELLKQKLTIAARRALGSTATGGTAVATETTIDLGPSLEHVAVIAGEIRRLDQVVQGFLKFTRPEDMQLQPVDVGALLAEIAAVVTPEAKKAGIAIDVDAPSGLPALNADSGLLRQALLNLALNACQAMPQGGKLRLAARAAGGRVQVNVEDTGVGIPPEHLSRIFDLYFTTREKGSGIGLSMVYRIVQLHDGDIEVQSTPGAGTTFRLFLPARRVASSSGSHLPGGGARRGPSVVATQ